MSPAWYSSVDKWWIILLRRRLSSDIDMAMNKWDKGFPAMGLYNAYGGEQC